MVLDIPPVLSHKCVNCVDISSTLVKVINEVTEDLRYISDQPVLTFLCEYPHDPSISPHVAEYIKDDYLLCTKDPMVITKVTDANKLWLQGETYLLFSY